MLHFSLDTADDFIDGVTVRREKALDFSGCKSREAADKAASLEGENPTAVNCLIQTASIPDARNGNDA